METSRIRKDILATLTYFNMFDYPLRKREIYIFLAHKEEMDVFDMELNALVEASLVFTLGEFYCLFNNHALAERRRKGNEKAAAMLGKAGKAANLIARFPFVKGVAVSGSLSKRFADENADIDFFIITVANRLWIARTLLHMLKKITFLFRLQDCFCMNYFIDEASLCILEKNIYTATEVVTVMPLCGMAVFEKFYLANNWTKNYLPNNYLHISPAGEIRRNWFTSMIESMFKNPLGNWVDTALMNKTARNWNRKTLENKKNSKGITLSMHVGKHFSKPNPENFQKRLLQRYQHCLAEILDQYEHATPAKNNFR